MSSVLNQENVFVATKWGQAMVINGDNYGQFSQNIRAIFAGCNTWGIVSGVEPAPGANATAAARSEYTKRLDISLQIFNSVIPVEITPRTNSFMLERDPAGIWQALKSFDKSDDVVFASNAKEEFSRLEFHPRVETLRQYHAKLVKYQLELANTPTSINDAEMKARLLASLPQDTAWKTMKLQLQTANNGNTSMEEILSTLQIVERELGASAAHKGSANLAKEEKARNKSPYGRKRGGRGRGYHGRGGSRSRESSANRQILGTEKLERNQCAFCYKKGHYMAECNSLKRQKEENARAAKGGSNSGRSGSSSGLKQEAAARHVMEVDDESETGSFYPEASFYASERANLSSTTHNPWYIDSGASKHFTHEKSDFTQITRFPTPKTVRTADGSCCKAQGYGDIVLQLGNGNKLVLRNVWFLPEFNCKLISVVCLNNDDISLLFAKGKASAFRNDREIFTASMLNGQYILDQDPANHAKIAGEMGVKREAIIATTTNSNSSGNSASPNSGKLSSAGDIANSLAHRRLGHISHNRIRLLKNHSTGLNISANSSIEQQGDRICEPCLAGSMKLKYSKKTTSRSTKRLRRLHADLSGILPQSIRGYRYFLVVVDDATRVCWVRLTRTKESSEILPILAQLRKQIELETGDKVVYFRCDNGKGEFSQALIDALQADGIVHEPSPEYEHWMNGVVERQMQELGKLIRSLCFEAKLPRTIWCYAVEHAAWINNRVPTSALPFGDDGSTVASQITPYAAFYGTLPDLSKLRVFGSLVKIAVPKEKKPHKLLPRTKDVTYIWAGIKSNTITKCLSTMLKLEHSTSIRVDETVFPGIEVPLAQEPMKRKLSLVAPVASKRRVAALPIRQLPEPQRVETPSGSQVQASLPENQLSLPGPPGSQNEIEGENGSLPTHDQDDSDPSGTVDDSNWPRSRYGRSLRRKVPFGEIVARRAIAGGDDDPEDQAFAVPGTTPLESISVKQALKDDPTNWVPAIQSELISLSKNGTYTILWGNPKGKRLIPTKWVFKIKYNVDGSIARYKARLVVRGDYQREGLDYLDTFASVVRWATLRTLLAKAAHEDLEIDAIDIDTAFLNPELEEEVYIKIPDHFEMAHPEVKNKEAYLRLRKSLYGLKQAPRAWFKDVIKFFNSLGLVQGDADSNLFKKGELYILLFVDDMLIVGVRAEVDAIKAEIKKKWKAKDMVNPKIFVGFQIERNRSAKTLRIHQELYISKLMERLQMSHCQIRATPCVTGMILRSIGDNKEGLLDDLKAALYRLIVGSCLYLAGCTRFDISYTVGQLARHMANPTVDHLAAAQHLIKYLNGTRDVGIVYGRSNDNTSPYQFTGYSDSTWGTELDDRKSFQGQFVLRNGGAVNWIANRQKTTSQGSMEAEIISANELGKDLAWFEKLVLDLNEQPHCPTLYCDNVAANEFNKDAGKFHNKAKHIEIRYMYVRNDMVPRNRVRIEWIAGSDQPADCLTKGLARELMSKHLKKMGMDLIRSG